MINEYLRGISGGEAYTSKDFRTWKGTAAAALCLIKSGHKGTPRQAIVRAIKEASELLGNTPPRWRAPPMWIRGLLRVTSRRTSSTSSQRRRRLPPT